MALPTTNPPIYGFNYAGSRLGNMPKPEIARVASAYQAQVSAANVDLRPGDPVKKVNDGTVSLAAAGEAIYAIIASVLPFQRTRDGQTYMDYGFQLPGGTTYSVQQNESRLMVIPVAGVLWEVMSDEATTAATEAAYIALIGENADHSLTRDATRLWAGPKLDTSDHKTATAQWRIVDINRRRQQDASLTNYSLIVTCNEVQQAPFQTTGV